ncbi:MAG TPA: hypothetical protein VGB85_17755, partial [Nannocystis sp.]
AAPAAKAPTPPDPDPSVDEGIACKVDADCPVLGCGPCTPGTPVTRRRLDGPACDVNPCEDAASVCTNQVCVVHPGTHKDPAVWGTATPRP